MTYWDQKMAFLDRNASAAAILGHDCEVPAFEFEVDVVVGEIF
jgi:hypothetical protein